VYVNLDANFTGTLYLPDKVVPSGTSPVLLSDGRTIAQVQWHMWTVRSRFEILDPLGRVLAEGRSHGFAGRQFAVRTPAGRVLVNIKLGVWRPISGATVTLSNGTPISVKQISVWSDRNFQILRGGEPVGRISPTTGKFTARPDSYAFELSAPVMSALEAIGLAQALRAVVRAARSARSAAT
jgi:hypothetical protein